MKLKWGIVAGEVVGFIRRMKRADFRWHTCMEVLQLQVMQCTREDEALAAAVQGTVLEDSRDALAQVAVLLQGCMDATSWRDCGVGLHEIDALIDEVKKGSYDQI